MTTIKKITTKTLFFLTAIISFSFAFSLIGKFFFGESETSLVRLASVINGNDAKAPGLFISNVQADEPIGGSSGGDGSVGGGCGGSGGGSADGSAGF